MKLQRLQLLINVIGYFYLLVTALGTIHYHYLFNCILPKSFCVFIVLCFGTINQYH